MTSLGPKCSEKATSTTKTSDGRIKQIVIPCMLDENHPERHKNALVGEWGTPCDHVLTETPLRGGRTRWECQFILDHTGSHYNENGPKHWSNEYKGRDPWPCDFKAGGYKCGGVDKHDGPHQIVRDGVTTRIERDRQHLCNSVNPDEHRIASLCDHPKGHNGRHENRYLNQYWSDIIVPICTSTYGAKQCTLPQGHTTMHENGDRRWQSQQSDLRCKSNSPSGKRCELFDKHNDHHKNGHARWSDNAPPPLAARCGAPNPRVGSVSYCVRARNHRHDYHEDAHGATWVVSAPPAPTGNAPARREPAHLNGKKQTDVWNWSAQFPCCDSHVLGLPCCDPNDCGPCCEKCPTCPTLQYQRGYGQAIGDAMTAVDSELQINLREPPHSVLGRLKQKILNLAKP